MHTPTIVLSVLFCRRPAQVSGWEYQQWDLTGILPRPGHARGPEVMRRAGAAEILGWHGLGLSLHRDLAESYWANLVSEVPALFVVCRDDEDGFRPLYVTASGEEAAGHGEVDDKIFSSPMPPSVLRTVERFTVENYKPQARKKRRRES